MTRLRKIMLEELQQRNFSSATLAAKEVIGRVGHRVVEATGLKLKWDSGAWQPEIRPRKLILFPGRANTFRVVLNWRKERVTHDSENAVTEAALHLCTDL